MTTHRGAEHRTIPRNVRVFDRFCAGDVAVASPREVGGDVPRLRIDAGLLSTGCPARRHAGPAGASCTDAIVVDGDATERRLSLIVPGAQLVTNSL